MRTSKEIFNEIKQNQEKRKSCDLHEIEYISFGKYKCNKCGATFDGVYVSGYMDAYKALTGKELNITDKTN